MHSNFILDIENTFIKMKKKKAMQIDLKRKHFKHQYKYINKSLKRKKKGVQ